MYRSIVILALFLACLWETGLSQNKNAGGWGMSLGEPVAGSGEGSVTFEDDEDLADDASGSGSGSGSGWRAEDRLEVSLTTPTKMTSTMASTAPTTARPLTQCQRTLETRRRLGASKHLPRCDPRGEYEPLQCDGEEGSDDCWCGDLQGSEIPGTRMEAPNVPNCHHGTNLHPCVFLTVQAIRNPRLGSFRPQCTTDGQFVPLQCHGSICFCVDEDTGKKVAGTERHLPNAPNCDDDSMTEEKLTPLTGHEDKDSEEEKDSSEEDRDSGIGFPPTFEDKDDTISVDGGDSPDGDYDKDNINIGSPNKVKPGVPEDKDSGDQDQTDGEDNRTGTKDDQVDPLGKPEGNRSRVTDNQILTQPGLLGGIIGAAVILLLGLVLLVMFIIYRMRKKDEGSYPLDEPKRPNYSYVRAPEKEYYA